MYCGGTLEHDPEKACPALDAGWVPVSRLREAFGTIRPFDLMLRRAKAGRKKIMLQEEV